jgi:beta-glucosidase-like glycosyl hydrolase
LDFFFFFLLASSYNEINGIPSCANSGMLTDLLRDSWGFDGYVTSDCGAVDDVMYTHYYTNTTDDTCVATLTAGMDRFELPPRCCGYIVDIVK